MRRADGSEWGPWRDVVSEDKGNTTVRMLSRNEKTTSSPRNSESPQKWQCGTGRSEPMPNIYTVLTFLPIPLPRLLSHRGSELYRLVLHYACLPHPCCRDMRTKVNTPERIRHA